MTEKGIKKVLSVLNIPVSSGETGFVQIPKLDRILTVNNGNQYYNYEQDLINFDITNELVKIKEYTSKACSGILKGAFDSKTVFLVRHYFEFRAPKVGDKFIIINMKNGNKIFESTITSVNYYSLTIADEYTVTDFSGKRIVYVDAGDYKTSYEDPQYPGRYLKLTPKTKYTSDIYIGFDVIEGFKFN